MLYDESFSSSFERARHGRDRIVVGFITYAMPITTNVASSNPAHCEVYSIQYYVMKLVSNVWQVSLFSPGTPVSSTNKN